MFGDLKDMMGRLGEIKAMAEATKLKLEETTINIEGAGGDIKIEINGNRKIKNLTIAASLQHGDKEELEEQLTVTLNKAIAAADELNEKEMKSAAGGLLPGM